MIRTFDYRADGGFSVLTDDPRAIEVLSECNLIVTYDPLDHRVHTIHGTRANATKAIRRLLPMMKANNV